MRLFLAIIYCFMNLAGCTDAQNRSLLMTVSDNGRITLDSRTDVRMGRARFACAASDSGQCNYTVFDGATTVRTFALAVREERLVDHLPGGFTLCVRPQSGVVTPDCKPA